MKRLKVDYLDILNLHDIEYNDDGVLRTITNINVSTGHNRQAGFDRYLSRLELVTQQADCFGTRPDEDNAFV